MIDNLRQKLFSWIKSPSGPFLGSLEARISTDDCDTSLAIKVNSQYEFPIHGDPPHSDIQPIVDQNFTSPETDTSSTYLPSNNDSFNSVESPTTPPYSKSIGVPLSHIICKDASIENKEFLHLDCTPKHLTAAEKNGFPNTLVDAKHQYVYIFEKVYHGKVGGDSLAYYRCQYSHQNCRARVSWNKAIQSAVKSSKKSHICDLQFHSIPDLMPFRPTEKEVRAFAKMEASKCDSYKQLEELCFQFSHENSTDDYPTFVLHRAQCMDIYRKHHRQDGLPTFTTNKFGNPQCLSLTYYDKRPVATFICPELLCHVDSFKICHYDGTFHVATHPFCQCLIFGGVKQGIFVPVFYTFVCQKTEGLYCYVWRSILHHLLARNLKIPEDSKLICDFEIAMYKPFLQSHPGNPFKFNYIQLCYFHFAQLLRRRFDDIGVAKDCRLAWITKKILRNLPHCSNTSIDKLSHVLLDFLISADESQFLPISFDLRPFPKIKEDQGLPNLEQTSSFFKPDPFTEKVPRSKRVDLPQKDQLPNPKTIVSQVTECVKKFVECYCCPQSRYRMVYWSFDQKPSIRERTNNFLESHNKVISANVDSFSTFLSNLSVNEVSVINALSSTAPSQKENAKALSQTEFEAILTEFDEMLTHPLFKCYFSQLAMADEHNQAFKIPSQSSTVPKPSSRRTPNPSSIRRSGRHPELPIPQTEKGGQRNTRGRPKKKGTK